MAAPSERSRLERVLGVVTEVRAGEGPTALLMVLNVFLVLTAYYMIKPVREGLILAMPGGAEKKSFLGAVIALTLLVAVPAYGRAADRLPKHKLVVGVTLFFASHLLVFYALSRTSLESSLGVAFFVWVGIFNMMLLAQFWSFANDVYSEEQGKRLFALVGIGSSAGGIAGSYLTKQLVKPLGTYQLLLVSAVLLGLSAFVTRKVAVREQARKAAVAPDEGAARAARVPGDQSGTFALVMRNKYLRLIALFALLFTWVNTNGEYMLGAMVGASAKEAAHAAAVVAGADFNARAFTAKYATAFYSDFFFYVNVLVAILQTFVVSRLVRFGGLRAALLVLPAIALLDAVTVAVSPVLAILRIGKIAENASDYSVNNTARNMLWLPTTREMKYKAKQAVDTFFVRMGDVASWVLVEVGAARMGWPIRNFGLFNIGLVAAWLVVARGIIREEARLTGIASSSRDRTP